MYTTRISCGGGEPLPSKASCPHAPNLFFLIYLDSEKLNQNILYSVATSKINYLFNIAYMTQRQTPGCSGTPLKEHTDNRHRQNLTATKFSNG